MMVINNALLCSPTRKQGSARRRAPRLCVDWNNVETPPPTMPVPEKPTPLPPEMPQPQVPVGAPPPTENPIPMREPPITLPTQW